MLSFLGLSNLAQKMHFVIMRNLSQKMGFPNTLKKTFKGWQHIVSFSHLDLAFLPHVSSHPEGLFI